MTAAAEKIAALVSEAGGRAYYVGGYVRDRLLGESSKDIDIEVHGISADSLKEILQSVGDVVTVGLSFGVYKIRGLDIDIALPRTETNTGRGHRDFEIFTDPDLGTYKACRRRDFTVNAMMMDVLTGEVTDHFGGRQDLAKGIIRHVDSETFAEDPLRVLRCAQFAARLGFDVAEETVKLCSEMDIEALPSERVEEELKKALLKADRPSVFFETLRRMGKLSPWFEEIESLAGIPQDPTYHPEGDVWTHTMQVLDKAAKLRDKATDPYPFMLLALAHDVGKSNTTELTGGRLHAYDHENAGLPDIEKFLRRITGNRDVIRYVLNMVPLHMKPNIMAHARSAVKSTNRMFDAATSPNDLIWFAEADRPLMVGDGEFRGTTEFLLERLEIFSEMMSRPFVQGKDLIEAGLVPGESFNELLELAHKLRLAGVDRESAMKQVLAMNRQITKKQEKSN